MKLNHEKLLLASLTDAVSISVLNDKPVITIDTDRCYSAGTRAEGLFSVVVPEYDFMSFAAEKKLVCKPLTVTVFTVEDDEPVKTFLKLPFKGSELVNELRSQLGIVPEKGNFTGRV